MEIEVKIIGRKDVQASDRESVIIETHSKRGDIYNVARSDTVLENDSATFRLRGGDRLLITTPEGREEVVYDRDQGAAVRRSSLEESGRVASDAPPQHTNVAGLTPEQKAKQDELARQQAAQAARQKADEEAKARAAANQKLADEAAAKQKAADAEKAKQQQQSGAGRPAGETAPKPGSPVGSPPSGNEGNKG